MNSNKNKKKENLSELKIKLKDKFPQLTERDLSSEDGRSDGMLRMVEYKLRKTKDEMSDIITNL